MIGESIRSGYCKRDRTNPTVLFVKETHFGSNKFTNSAIPCKRRTIVTHRSSFHHYLILIHLVPTVTVQECTFDIDKLKKLYYYSSMRIFASVL